jgi:hypothetical protein
MVFFSYLTGVSGSADNPFLTEKANKIFPNFARNRDRQISLSQNNPEELISRVRKEWFKYFDVPLILQEELAD